MLQAISKSIQGWIAWVIIFIIAAAFVLWGLEYYISRSGDQQNAVATVNGVKITARQFNNVYEAFQRNYTQQGVNLNESMQKNLKNMALQELILDQAILQKANKMGLSINPTQAQQVIWHIPDFQENGRFSPQRFQQLLSSNNIDQQTFMDKIINSLVVEQLSTGIEKSNFVTPAEAAQTYSLMQQSRDFKYLILPASAVPPSAPPQEEQINAYYQQHTDTFRTPEQVKVAYILLSPESLKAEIKVNDADVSQYYQDNSGEFTGKSFESVQSRIEQRLYQQQLNQVLSAKSEQLEDLVYANPDTLDTAAKTLGLPVKTTAFMSPEGLKGDPLFSDPKVLNAVFSDEVIKRNINSPPIELKNGGFIVVRAIKHQPSHLEPLAQVRQQIASQLQKDQNQKQAGLLAYQIQHALETGSSAESLAARYHLVWKTKIGATREDKTLPPPLLSAVFNTVPSQNPAKKAVTTLLMPDGNYAIIELDSFHNASNPAPAAEQTKLSAQLAKRWGELDYQLFLKSAIEKAKIKYLSKT